ncbi:cation diffusion facilitator family transporter [Legionella sp. km772]|uniref:cation diffusion facilitator family transporter n=1 Tax=Legionella sp. km772 TaxID=2498111 RepID=UPI000F8E21B2|nr:cation diffusion facilitator family transporter [Legionella sp. km772]RUR10544.1 cation diffusion facilitator family transporter [Legionella sp. km772]
MIHSNNALQEQRVLKISIAATFFLAVIGIVFGLLSGSLAIVFDGMENMVDTGMTLLALLVTRLLKSEGNRRFQYGYWHVEPLVLVFNGGTLVLLCLYALMNAIGSLLSGGRELDFDSAFFFAMLMAGLSIWMYLYIRYMNVKLQSEFLKLDIQSWLLSASVSSSLLLAFGIAHLMNNTSYTNLTPYVDPFILATLSAVLIVIPMKTVREAMRDIFLIAPFNLDEKVRNFLDALIQRKGFTKYTSYVAKIGRAQFIEIHIVVPTNYPIEGVESLDEIRREIGIALGENGPEMWLTVAFTTEEQWI